VSTTLQLLTSTRNIDCILLLMLVEAGALTLYLRHRSYRANWLDVLSALLPGAFLLLAVRAALGGATLLLAVALLAALLAHLADLVRRFRGTARQG